MDENHQNPRDVHPAGVGSRSTSNCGALTCRRTIWPSGLVLVRVAQRVPVSQSTSTDFEAPSDCRQSPLLPRYAAKKSLVCMRLCRGPASLNSCGAIHASRLLGTRHHACRTGGVSNPPESNAMPPMATLPGFDGRLLGLHIHTRESCALSAVRVWIAQTRGCFAW